MLKLLPRKRAGFLWFNSYYVNLTESHRTFCANSSFLITHNHKTQNIQRHIFSLLTLHCLFYILIIMAFNFLVCSFWQNTVRNENLNSRIHSWWLCFWYLRQLSQLWILTQRTVFVSRRLYRFQLTWMIPQLRMHRTFLPSYSFNETNNNNNNYNTNNTIIFMQDNPVSVINTVIKEGPVINSLIFLRTRV